MRFTRLYLDATLTPDTTLELDERAAHHVARVLRMKPGDEVRLFDGRGTEVLARLERVEKKRVTAAVCCYRSPTNSSV